MISRQLQTLFQRSKTTDHLLQLHSLILKTALDHDHYFLSHFIRCLCSVSIDLAQLVFDGSPVTPPLFAWNTVIKEYSKSTKPIESIKLFSQLRRIELKPDHYTYPFVIKACGRCSQVGVGGAVHSVILKAGFDWDHYIRNTLLMMYGACSEIGPARQVFDEMSERDLVSWSSMMAAYVTCNRPLDALMVLHDMKLVNQKPNSITLVTLLSACTRLFNIRLGKSIHSYVLANHIELDVGLGTALLDMYAKCGCIEKAFHIFNFMTQKNLQSWTVMISCFADHGRIEKAFYLFTKMEQTGLKPDSMLFSGILSACSHLGLVGEGQRYFEKMLRIYNIRPTMEHYGCMVDMFGRAGMIEEAYQIIKNMPVKPNSIILRSFMSACKNQGIILSLNEDIRELLLEIEPDLGANYVLAASVSSLSGYWKIAGDMRVAMKDKGLKKVQGCSWRS